MKSSSSASDEISEPVLFTYSGFHNFFQKTAKTETSENQEDQQTEPPENSEQLLDILSE